GLSLTESHTQFLSSANESKATTMDWFMAGTPKGPWSYRMGVNMLLTGGQTLYGQNSFGLDANLSHKLSDRQRLSFLMHSGRTTGYLPQNENYFLLSHEYQVYQNIALRTSYAWRKLHNSDPTLIAGAYRARGLDIELTFDFIP
ncbi:MAG: hypothetical protein QOJ65_630, partial [Fimbriimonadaceae bacterium]|nr:hypothetical protein [Fimbriimonadaceae bacterium]